MPAIYRAEADATPGEPKLPHPNSRRIPKNIPYVVDNLWEWSRPGGLASRPDCAYGSRSAEEAARFGIGEVYRVEFLGDHRICQVQGYSDAKHHPDVQEVKKAVFELLGGYDWSNQLISAKANAGRLYIPGLSAKEVEQVLRESGMTQGQKEELRQGINFWDDVAVVQEEEPFPDSDGEIFFTYAGGYVLREVASG